MRREWKPSMLDVDWMKRINKKRQSLIDTLKGRSLLFEGEMEDQVAGQVARSIELLINEKIEELRTEMHQLARGIPDR